MLEANAESWWANAKRMIKDSQTFIWEVFKVALYSKYGKPNEDAFGKRMLSQYQRTRYVPYRKRQLQFGRGTSGQLLKRMVNLGCLKCGKNHGGWACLAG